jgi:hypothetical protein
MDATVAVPIGGRSFSCSSLAQADFANIAAIYVILCVKPDKSWKVLDVGQTGELGSRIDSHDRRECWVKNCETKNIWVCVYHMPSGTYSPEDRRALEAALRRQYSPVPCGQR